MVKYFDERARIAEKTKRILSARGCIFDKARGRISTSTEKLFSIIYIEIKIIDW